MEENHRTTCNKPLTVVTVIDCLQLDL